VSWFAYVGQNPLRYIDPSGLRRVDGDTADSDADKVQRNSDFEERKRKVRVRKEVDSDIDELTSKAAQRDDPDLSPQERADLEDEINQLQQDVVRNINDLIVSGYEVDRLLESMGAYNRTVLYNAASWVKNGEIVSAGSFGASANRMQVIKDGLTRYLTYIHSGVDVTAGSHLQTPLFVQAIDAFEDTLVLGIIGTNNRVALQHLSIETLSQIELDQVYSPGIMATLTVTGEGTNAHVHVEETVKIGESLLGEEIRGFVNPNTHTGLRPETDFWGRYEDLNSIIIEGVFVEWFSIYKSWNSTTAH
jgi:hypothetical protein